MGKHSKKYLERTACVYFGLLMLFIFLFFYGASGNTWWHKGISGCSAICGFICAMVVRGAIQLWPGQDKG